MHLINVNTDRLEEFSPRQKPKYAVLSHRWTKNEVTFTDIRSKTLRSASIPDKFSYTLRQTCRDGLEYAWIDTCCIDKQSSTELSEAINSMYQWYQDAKICYVYLEDVKKENWQETLQRSEWFKRGWTLQELLAPQSVIFYDRSWQRLGDKTSLADRISVATGIAADILQTRDFSRCSVAQKMAWAAKRITTRPEDQAYCLMGLFSVNMPLLYGEGEKAFLRLQEEIIRHSDDHSIFAWSMGKRKVSGLFAPAPSSFTKSQRVVSDLFAEARKPFSMTNRGLSIELRVTPWSADTYLAYLDCADESRTHENKVRLGIFLRRLSAADQYIRINYARKGLWFDTQKSQHLQRAYLEQDRPFEDRQMFVRQSVDVHYEEDCLKDRVYGFKIPDCYLTSSIVYPPAVHFSPDTYIAALLPSGWGCVVRIDMSAHHVGLRKIALGFDFDFNPLCLLEDSFSKSAWLESWDIWSRVQMNEILWNPIIEGGRVIRPETYEHDGLWALKGDRREGLNVILSVAPTGDGPIVTLKRKIVDSRLVWAFDIDNLVGSSRHYDCKVLFGHHDNSAW